MSESEPNIIFQPARLREERERLGYKISEFAEKVGTTRQTQTKYEKLERKPDTDYLAKASELGVDIYYVITGSRSHFNNQDKNTKNKDCSENSVTYEKWDQKNQVGSSDPTSTNKVGSSDLDHESNSETVLNEFTPIPLFDVKASAGNGYVIHQEEKTDSLIFKKEWIYNELHSSPANLYLIYVDGDSMEPSLCPGDVILVDHTDNVAKRDGIYVIRMGDSLLVKRLQRLPNRVLKVNSDNPDYESFEISLDVDHGTEFMIIGRVVWSGRRH